MSNDERDLILMQMRRDCKDAQVTLVALKNKAEGLGKAYEDLGRQLREDAGAITFSTSTEVLPGRGVYGRNRSQFDISEVVQTVEDIHRTEIAIEKYRQQLQLADLA